jgi:hypothetical protein
MSEKLILKYLNPSSVTAKGHMKRPHHSIRSTRPKPPTARIVVLVPIIPPVLSPMNIPIVHDEYCQAIPSPAIIDGNSNKSSANISCFGPFADRQSGVIYNNLTGNFSFMSCNGSVCFLVIYQYKSNAILTLPINGLNEKQFLKHIKLHSMK